MHGFEYRSKRAKTRCRIGSETSRKLKELSVEPFGVLFGRLVREKRGIEGLSLDKLVAATGISKPSLSNLENGKIANPQAKTVDALCVALEIVREERNACHPVTDAPHLPPRMLENLALRFGHDSPEASEDELENFLRSRAAEYLEMCERLEEITATDSKIEDLREAAKAALDRGDLLPAQSLLAEAENFHRRQRVEGLVRQHVEVINERAIVALRAAHIEAAAQHMNSAADHLLPYDAKESAEYLFAGAAKLIEEGRLGKISGIVEAVELLKKALLIWEEAGDLPRQADTHSTLALALQELARVRGG